MLTHLIISHWHLLIEEESQDLSFFALQLWGLSTFGEPAVSPTPVPISRYSHLVKSKLSEPIAEDNKSASDSSSTIEDDESEYGLAPPHEGKKRPRAVEEALIEGGWVLKRSKKHLFYSRRVKLSSGRSSKLHSVENIQ